MADKTVAVRFIARVGQYQAALAKASGSNVAFATSASASFRKANSTLKALGAASLFAGKAVVLGIGGALAVSAKAAIDFESSLAGVSKTVKASDAQINSLGEALRRMSLTTPVNVNELLGIAEVGGQLGIPLSRMEDFVEVIAALGATTDLTGAQAAKSLARFANVMGTSFNDFEKLGSILVELGNNFAASESEILNFALRLAPIGAIINATEAEIFGLATGFAQLGIPAERGATAIQRTFLDIEKRINAGGDSLEDFLEVVGLTEEQLTRMSQIDQFLALIDGLNRIEESGGSAAAALVNLGIGQQRTISTLLAAAAAGDQFSRAISVANQEAKEGNALFEEAAKRYGTTASQIRLMANAFNDFRIELGQGVIPLIRTAIQFFIDWFVGLKENIDQLKRFGGWLKWLVGAQVGVLFLAFLAKMGSAIAVIVTAFKVGGTAAALFGGILSVLAGAIGVVVIGVALLTLKWANAARKARELAEGAKILNDALEDGEDPLVTWRERMEEIVKDGFDPFRDALRFNGIGIDRWIKSLAGGADTANAFSDEIQQTVADLLRMAGAVAQTEFEAGRLGIVNWADSFNGLADSVGHLTAADLAGAIKDIEDLLPEGETSPFLQALKNFAFILPVIGKGLDQVGAQAGDTQRRLDEAAIRFRDALDAGDFAENAAHIAAFLEDSTAAWETLPKVVKTAREKMMEEILELNEGEGGLETFNTGMLNIITTALDMRDGISDAFEDIKTELINAIDPWEKFEAKHLHSGKNIVKNTRDRVNAMIAFNDLISENTFGMSDDTIQFFEDMDLESQAAMADMADKNPKHFATMVDDLGVEFDRLAALAEEKLDLTEIATAMLVDLAEVVLEEAVELGLTGDAAITFMEVGMEAGLAALPEELRPFLNAALKEVLTDTEFRAMLGSESAKNALPILRGFRDGIKQNIGIMENVMRWAARRANLAFELQFGFGSPSKVAMSWGQNIMEGFGIGLKRGFAEFGIPEEFRSMSQAMFGNRAPSGGLGASSGGSVSTRTLEMHMHNPQFKDPLEDTRSMLALASIVEDMESGSTLR